MFKCMKGVSQLRKPFLSIRAVMWTRNLNIILSGVSELLHFSIDWLFLSYAYASVCTCIPKIGSLTKVFLRLCGMVEGSSKWGRKLPLNLAGAYINDAFHSHPLHCQSVFCNIVTLFNMLSTFIRMTLDIFHCLDFLF